MEFEQERARQTERNFCQNANLPGGAGAAAPPKILCVSQQCAMIGQAGPGQAVKQKRTMLWADPFEEQLMFHIFIFLLFALDCSFCSDIFITYDKFISK